MGFSMLSTSFSENRGKLLENAVAIELFRRRKECFYYKGRRECDFIIREGNKPTMAIQVSWELNTKSELRELKGLQEAMTSFNIEKGIILTYDEENIIKFENTNIDVMPVWKWLLQTDPM